MKEIFKIQKLKHQIQDQSYIIRIKFYNINYSFEISQKMGNQIPNQPTISMEEYYPPLQQFKIKQSHQGYRVWQNNNIIETLFEYQINIENQTSLYDQIQTFKFRNRHHWLVSSLYWKYFDQSLVQNTKISIFFERVFTTLSRIKDIPFNDSLHFYYVGLKGFELLYRKYGYFQISENMFFISQNNKLKVWCNKNIQKTLPQKAHALGFQAVMVRKIIQLIDQNTDYPPQGFPLGSILYEQASNSFEFAIQKLKQLCQQFNWKIPEKLSSLQQLSKQQIQNILDQYSRQNSRIANKQQIRKSRGLNLSRSYEKKNHIQNRSPGPEIRKVQNKPVTISRPQSVVLNSKPPSQIQQQPVYKKPPSQHLCSPKFPQRNPIIFQPRSRPVSKMSRPVSSHHSKSPNIVINYARPQSRSIEKVNFRPTYQVKQENLQIPLSHKANNERTNYPPVHQKKFERQESTPILSYHKSEVSDNNTPVKRVQFERQKEKQNRRSNFEEYKKNFNYQQKKEQANLYTNSELWQEIQSIKKKYEKRESNEPTYSSNNTKTGGFFGMNFGKQTVVSYPGSDIEKENMEQARKSNFSHEQKKQGMSFLPSVTDISNNMSILPLKQNGRQKEENSSWKGTENSIVVQHKMNKSGNYPEELKYNPSIDQDIWSDVLKLRKK